jgi:hypothetical protein
VHQSNSSIQQQHKWSDGPTSTNHWMYMISGMLVLFSPANMATTTMIFGTVAVGQFSRKQQNNSNTPMQTGQPSTTTMTSSPQQLFNLVKAQHSNKYLLTASNLSHTFNPSSSCFNISILLGTPFCSLYCFLKYEPFWFLYTIPSVVSLLFMISLTVSFLIALCHIVWVTN